MNLLRWLPRFRRAQRELSVLEAREQWTRAEIDAYQLERLNALWAHAIEHVVHYRELALAQRLPRRFSSVAEFQATVPMLCRDEIRGKQNEFLSARAAAGSWHHSGGSTGVPTSYFRSHVAHQEMLRGRYRFHAMWDVDLFDRWAFLWGHAASFAAGLPGRIERIRQPIHDRLRNRIRLSAYRLGKDDLQSHMQRIAAFRPAAIYGYSTAVYLLAQEAKATNFSCPSLKLVVLTAEPAFLHIVNQCEDAFGVPAVVEYGSAECGIMAVEWPDRTIRVREDQVLLETHPRTDGRFDIVVTVLNNPSFPLIRYAIGDVTDAALRQPDAGFAILSNIAGRHQDLLSSRSGEPLFAGWFEDVLEHTDAVRRYQVHQRASGDLAVTLELCRPDAPLDIRRLQKTLENHIGYAATITVVNTMTPTAAGKHRWITSELSPKTSGEAVSGGAPAGHSSLIRG